jgi:hypothetical protein
MPRGVPASGKRQPRVVSASQFEAEASVAGGSLDLPDRVDPPVVAQEHPASPGVSYPSFAVVEDTPEPVPELTPEQKEIARLRDQLARVSGKKDVLPEVDDTVHEDGEVIRIHFLEDGLTVNGRMMYRGDELEFVVGGGAYRDTFNRLGKTWLDYRLDEFGQVERYGKVFFRNGAWPGKTYADGTYESLKAVAGEGTVTAPSQDEIAAAERARKKRAAPRLPSMTVS